MQRFDTESAAKAFAKAKEAQHYLTTITKLYPDGVTAIWQVDWYYSF